MSQKETQHDPPAEEENTTLAGSAMDIVNEQRQEGKISGATVGKFLSRLGKAKVKDVNVDPKLDDVDPAKDPPSLESRATMDEEGMINVWVDLKQQLENLPYTPADTAQGEVREAGVDKEGYQNCPPLNIVIFIVGSRGDVQPYLSLALHLILSHSHRVRLATHPDFKDFVIDANKRLSGKTGRDGKPLEGKLEFFDIGGSPKELMAYMVKNPGLLPAWETLRNGDISSKRRMTAQMLDGFWEATFAPDTVTGKPFAVDAIISNPPAFGHVHIAEALGVPLMMSFTMPWTPSTSFKHPLVNVKETNAEKSLTNRLSYDLANMLQWQGLGDIINSFRAVTLGIEPLNRSAGPTVLESLKIPYTYCWSEGLIQKPPDWGSNVEISGFYFLEAESDFKPAPELVKFLEAGEPPIYIGFGSVVVEDAEAMTKTIMDAIKKAGVRALVSAGWGGLGGADVPDEVFILKGNIPHDWLFADGRVKAVCHHGGAGTTAIGLRNGLPTIVVPFFGDQKFWGEMIHRAGAGPAPIPQKTLTVDNLSEAFKFSMTEEVAKAAGKMGEQIRSEDGEKHGVEAFHRHLPLKNMRCDLDPDRVAVWKSKKHYLKLSAAAAGVLETEGKVRFSDLQPLRTKEYHIQTANKSSVPTETFGEHFGGITQMMWDTKRGSVIAAVAVPQNVLDYLVDVHSGVASIPKLLGSTHTRQSAPVKDFSSGIREGGKGLWYGWWDGITGLVTEPAQGAQKEGAAGFLKGLGRSWVNVTARPAAGIIGAAALPLYGTWQGLRKQFAGRPDLALRHPREEISRAEAKALTTEERQEMKRKFDDLVKHDVMEERKQRRRESERKLRARLEAEANKRVAAEGGTAKADKGDDTAADKGESEDGAASESEVLWEDEGASGPGGLNDQQRGEVEEGRREQQGKHEGKDGKQVSEEERKKEEGGKHE